MDNISLKELKSKPTPLLYSSNIVIILTNDPRQPLVHSLCHLCFLPIYIIKNFLIDLFLNDDICSYAKS